MPGKFTTGDRTRVLQDMADGEKGLQKLKKTRMGRLAFVPFPKKCAGPSVCSKNPNQKLGWSRRRTEMRKTTIARILSVALVLLSACAIATPSLAQVAVGVSVSFAPPNLPVYEQPLCPGEDYIWTPGYWDWDGDDYYWVPGTWVLAPEPGFFWTPGYWAWGDSGFIFTAGYWGPVVGFYGGINYGYGYFGRGYEGGRWDRGHFFYNREVNNVNVNIVHNTYNTTVVNKTVNVTRVSYNGGNGGVNVRPTPQEKAAIHERHIPPVPAQAQHIQQARSNPQLRAMTNQGRPPIAATMKPADFKGNGIVPAREGGALHHNIARPGNGNSPPGSIA